MKCNLRSKEPKCSVMEKEMHHPSSDSWRHFSRKDSEKVFCLHRCEAQGAEKCCFQLTYRGYHRFFSPPRKLHVHFLSIGTPMRSTAGIANGLFLLRVAPTVAQVGGSLDGYLNQRLAPQAARLNYAQKQSWTPGEVLRQQNWTSNLNQITQLSAPKLSAGSAGTGSDLQHFLLPFYLEHPKAWP